MSENGFRRRRSWLFPLLMLVMILCGVSFTGRPVAADEELVPYVRIEEDWKLEILTPGNNTNGGGPHVVTQMAPSSNSDYFAAFQVNHRNLPDYQAGGLQVQIWFQKINQSVKSYNGASMSTPDEVVTWTQYLDRTGGSLKFGVSAGSSTTWGNLANPNLGINVSGFSSDFKEYNSDYSVKNSGITHGANRVKTLTLMQVRKYRFDGTLGQLVFDVESVPRIVFSAPSN